MVVVVGAIAGAMGDAVVMGEMNLREDATARGTTGANASDEVAKRKMAERMAMMLFMAAKLMFLEEDSG